MSRRGNVSAGKASCLVEHLEEVSVSAPEGVCWGRGFSGMPGLPLEQGHARPCPLRFLNAQRDIFAAENPVYSYYTLDI